MALFGERPLKWDHALYLFLIPICVLNGSLKVGKASERTQAISVIGKSSQPLAQHINQQLKRREDTVVKVFFSQLVPNMFNWFQLRAVGRLGDQANILWNDQVIGFMPANSIHLYDDEVLREGLADLLQEEIHHLSGNLR